MKTLFRNYLKTFDGLSKEVWWLALVTLINRAGTMVIPFLSIYMTESMGFSFPQAGWIMSAFGLGSVAGSYLGGRLTNTFGYYKVMKYSLFLTGVLFILLQFVTGFWNMMLAIFLVMTVADSFRPAVFVAMSAYSKPGNKTRSVTLIRLAINLGVSAGPAVGGIIIGTVGYSGLFWLDGLTCIIATLVMIQVLNPKKSRVIDAEEEVSQPIHPMKDKAFVLLFMTMVVFGIIFLQYFSTMTVYYREVHMLTPFEIGLLLAFNGLTIFFFEMPLIHWLENTGRSKAMLILIGAVFIGMSFWVLNWTGWVGILVLGMFFMTIGEMIIFPFSNAFALERSKRGRQGSFMGFYTIAFSIAHIGGHNAGFQLIERLGYETVWYIFASATFVCVFLLLWLRKIVNIEKSLV